MTGPSWAPLCVVSCWLGWPGVSNWPHAHVWWLVLAVGWVGWGHGLGRLTSASRGCSPFRVLDLIPSPSSLQVVARGGSRSWKACRALGWAAVQCHLCCVLLVAVSQRPTQAQGGEKETLPLDGTSGVTACCKGVSQRDGVHANGVPQPPIRDQALGPPPGGGAVSF